MDNRLKFLYYKIVIERSTDAEGKVERVNGRTRPSNKPEYTGKSVYSLT